MLGRGFQWAAGIKLSSWLIGLQWRLWFQLFCPGILSALNFCCSAM